MFLSGDRTIAAGRPSHDISKMFVGEASRRDFESKSYN